MATTSFGRAKKPKRVTGPLDDKVKARLTGNHVIHSPEYVSSGSDHSGQGDGDFSPSLSELVSSFLESSNGVAQDDSAENESDSELSDSASGWAADLALGLRLERESADSFRDVLLSQVSTAMRALSSGCFNKPTLRRRRVMVFLRNLGHNAAICKTKWPRAGSLTAGSYEFIDVIDSSDPVSPNRYLIDLDFAGEFQIARPTDRYSHLLQSLPQIYVGRAEDLKRIVKFACDEARTSLKSRDLHLPPWRKNRYMQNKWFGPYRRTVNALPAETPLPEAVPTPRAAVKCRSVGFSAAAAATRTKIM